MGIRSVYSDEQYAEGKEGGKGKPKGGVGFQNGFFLQPLYAQTA